MNVTSVLAAAALAAAAPNSTASAADASRVVPPSGVIGVTDTMLSADFWIARTRDADRLLMTREEIEARDRETLAKDANVVDLAKIGPTLGRRQVLEWLNGVVSPLSSPPVDMAGRPLSSATLAEITANRNVEAIPAVQPTRYGLAVRRTLLRIYPTEIAAFPSAEARDFDSFAAGVLFPGDAVAILHHSRDGRWLLVQTWQGAAWAHASDIAGGSAQTVLAYAARAPYRVITGDEVRTAYTPEAPEVSELQLDMGVRAPLARLPADQPVNGAGPYAAWTLSLPVRGPDGALRFEPALLQKVRDSAPDYLPLTRANIIRQAFKFLGERYGWGHGFNARDCSGFTSDVYRSFGLVLPPNSGAQGASPAFRRERFTAASSHDQRLRAVLAADVGDLLVVPGHVMMILGRIDGEPYVIQDVPFAIFRDGRGELRRTKLNEVSVTPLLPLQFDDAHSYVDAMTSLVHVTAR